MKWSPNLTNRADRCLTAGMYRGFALRALWEAERFLMLSRWEEGSPSHEVRYAVEYGRYRRWMDLCEKTLEALDDETYDD